MRPDLATLTLLYVEDDDAVRSNAVEYLGRLCKVVYEAKNGQEAIDSWRKHRPDIIISDINMPRMGGLEMARYIRNEDCETQIIIATAHAETDYLLKAVELQLVKYLIKPITKHKLLDALEQCLQRIGAQQPDTVRLSSCCLFNAETQRLECGSQSIKLSRRERLLLQLLARHHSRIVAYEEIEAAVWPEEGMSQDALRSLVRSLRKKLPEEAIENVSGRGYKLNVYEV